MARTTTVSVKIDEKAIMSQIEKGIASAMKELGPKLLRYAKDNHRYENKTGSLTNSTISKQIENGLELMALEQYGLNIYDGFKSWSPDPWLAEAISDNMDMIIDTLNKQIAKSLK